MSLLREVEKVIVDIKLSYYDATENQKMFFNEVEKVRMESSKKRDADVRYVIKKHAAREAALILKLYEKYIKDDKEGK